MYSSSMQLVFSFLLCFSTIMGTNANFGFGSGFGWGSGGGSGGGGSSGAYFSLSFDFYDYSCPRANDIVISVLENAIARDPRMAASLLRLHFHDCFVQGCDASVLLDDSATIVSEKRAKPNVNSLRGFEVIDQIKAALEEECPGVVSCADILALAARDSTILSGGPKWEVALGRRDSRTANIKLANVSIPAPTFTFQRLLSAFNQQGLDQIDLVALSGAHTIGMARCTSFKNRLYNQNGNNQPDQTLEKSYLNELRTTCPSSGGDNNLSPLDYATPRSFDNTYFKLVLGGRGLLFSDETLVSGTSQNGGIVELVNLYAQDEDLFFSQFSMSMVKMGSISPLLGVNGEVRKNCRRIN